MWFGNLVGITNVISSGRMRWAGHVVNMGNEISVEKPPGERQDSGLMEGQ